MVKLVKMRRRVSNKVILGGLVGVALLVLAVASIKTDYLVWRYEETKRFGQGSQDVKVEIPALEKIWQNQLLRLRIKLPSDWSVSDKPEFNQFVNGKERFLDAVLTTGERKLVMEVVDKLWVYAELEKMALTDVADIEVKKLKSRGYALEEREYLNTDKVRLTLIKWTDGGDKYVRALAQKETKLFVIDGRSDAADETYFAILREVLATVVTI